MAAITVGEVIKKALRESGEPVKAKDLIARVEDEIDAPADSVRSELVRLKKAGDVMQPKYGYYELVKSQEVPTNAAIVIRHPETNEIWVTIELSSSLTVHEPVELVRGKVGGGGKISHDIG